MKKIYIDAGHGGDSIGASYKGRLEQDDTLRLSLAVGRLLKSQRNIEVKYSRTGNTNPTITARANEANAWGADYFISIHRNAFKPETTRGAETWVYSKIAITGDTYKRAERILDLLCEHAGFPNRGVHFGAPSYQDFGVNRLTNMSSCLLEVGFIDNTQDNETFDSNFEEMVYAIAKGLAEAVGEKLIVPGDIDGDGKVTAADARLALRAAVKLETLTEEGLIAADVDGDGKITSDDARTILRRTVGKD